MYKASSLVPSYSRYNKPFFLIPLKNYLHNNALPLNSLNVSSLGSGKKISSLLISILPGCFFLSLMKSKNAQNSEVLSSSLIHLAEGYVTVITICSWSFIKKNIIKEFFVYLKSN